jgi:hypothetical protein
LSASSSAANAGAQRRSAHRSARAAFAANLALETASECREVPFLRRSLEPSHHRASRRIVDLLQEPLVHGFVLNFGLYGRVASFSQ